MSNTIADKLLNAIDRAISPPKNTTRLLHELVCKFDPSARLAKEELAGLKSAQNRWQRGYDSTLSFSESAAKQRWSQHLSDGAVDHLSPAVRTRSLESLVTEYASKMLVAKSDMATASCDGAKIVNAVSPRILSAAEKLLSARLETERIECEQFGLIPVPSPVTNALKAFANGLKVQHVGAPGHPPHDMLPFIAND